MADDDVQLTDLEVIQQFSLAVRGASASRDDVIAALEADLAWLTGTRRAKAPVAKPAAAVLAKKAPATKAPAKAATKAPTKGATKATRARA